ncbi:MAG: diguanylate cyclase [Acidobacteriota bacterium]|nr:diguanylate cyclase [Acidobacteriota bacterium]
MAGFPLRGSILALCLSLPALAAAQPAAAPATAELQARAAALEGLDRARALADLVDRLRTENPQQAIAYAHDALALFARHPDPDAHVRTLNEMAWAHMQMGAFGEARDRAGEAHTLADQNGDARGRGRALNNLGVIAQRSGNASVAVGFFEQSLDIYRGLRSQTDISNALNNLGFVYGTDLADYEKSLEYHVEALRVREALQDNGAIALSLNNIGIVYARLGERERALQYFERSLELRRRVGAVNRTGGTLSNMGDVYLEMGDLEKAFQYHRESLEIRRSIGERPGVANSLKNLGSIYAAMRKPVEARQFLSEALATSRELGDRTTETQSLIGLASLEHRLGRGREAAALAASALSIAEATKSRELQRRALEQLASGEELAGRAVPALAAYKRFKTLEGEIFAEDKARRLETLERRYQGEKVQAENERLLSRQALNELQASRSRTQRNAVAAAGALALVVGVFMYRRRVDAARLASELSVTDSLTGLRNRRFVQQTIEADVAAVVRRARTDPDAALVFMMLDVDHFKAINDGHGHKGGDLILTGVAGVLRATCRASDTITRWGGEEFLIVCREMPARDSAVLAERLRSAIEAQPFALPGGATLRCTCSIGFSSLPSKVSDGAPELTWEQAIALADRGLYEAKREGRNRWVDADRLLAPGSLLPGPADGLQPARA